MTEPYKPLSETEFNSYSIQAHNFGGKGFGQSVSQDWWWHRREYRRLRDLATFILSQEAKTRWPCPGCGRAEDEPLRVLGVHDTIEGNDLGQWVGCFYCTVFDRILEKTHETVDGVVKA